MILHDTVVVVLIFAAGFADLLTTQYALARFGVAQEANPYVYQMFSTKGIWHHSHFVKQILLGIIFVALYLFSHFFSHYLKDAMLGIALFARTYAPIHNIFSYIARHFQEKYGVFEGSEEVPPPHAEYLYNNGSRDLTCGTLLIGIGLYHFLTSDRLYILTAGIAIVSTVFFLYFSWRNIYKREN